ncbi:MAG: glycoside hydrolase family 99-like domain-containing protein, partial [Turicibacter sp.]
YKYVLNSSKLYVNEPYELYRCVFPAWDNEARKPGKGHVFHGSTPKLYADWLNNACHYAKKHTENKLVFINAWNEWAEGAFLEPDRKNGYAYLDETYKVMKLHSSKTLISVIMPVFNHERYVYNAIKSVVEQTYKNIELIIIDDGSIDNSVFEIERAINDFSNRINISLIKKNNGGSQKAIEIGVENSVGDIISIINSDDIYSDDRLEKCMMEYLSGDYSLIFTGVEFIDDNGQVVNANLNKGYYDSISEVESRGLFEACKKFNLSFSTGNLFMTKQLYKDLGGFADYKLCHDWDFLLRALNKYKVCFIDDKCYKYRYHESNTFSQLTELAVSETNSILSKFK